MLDTLAAMLAGHQDSAVVLPGHGPTTTIGRERAANPFLRGLATAPERGL
jgi:hydroxyacylglutathione hydrolase